MTDADSCGVMPCISWTCSDHLLLDIMRQLQADINVIVVADAETVGSGAKEVHFGSGPLAEQHRAHLLEGLLLALLLLRAGPQRVNHLYKGFTQLCHISLWRWVTKHSVPANSATLIDGCHGRPPGCFGAWVGNIY